MNLSTTSDSELIKSFMDDAEVFISQLPPIEPEIRHIFSPGVYIRQMILKAGTILTSKVHRTEHTFMVSAGRILVYDGVHEAVILKASYTGQTLPGTRRMGIALEDTVWTNIHPTRIKPEDNTEAALIEAVNKIERNVIEPYKNLKLKNFKRQEV